MWCNAEMDVSFNVRPTSDKGKAAIHVLGCLSFDEGDEVDIPRLAGWAMWETFQKACDYSGKGYKPSYNAFKSVLNDLETHRLVRCVGHVVGRARNSAAAKVFEITSEGLDWVDHHSHEMQTPYSTPDRPEPGSMPRKAVPLLHKLAASGKPMFVKNGDRDVWVAWRWLRENGYAKSLIQITDEGREFLSRSSSSSSIEGKV